MNDCLSPERKGFPGGLKSSIATKYLLLLLFLVLGYYMNSAYRPYIYRNGLNDFGIADMGTNILFVPIGLLLQHILPQKTVFTDNRKFILYSFLALAAHELLSYWIPMLGHFDFKDVIGLAIGAVLSVKMDAFFDE